MHGVILNPKYQPSKKQKAGSENYRLHSVPNRSNIRPLVLEVCMIHSLSAPRRWVLRALSGVSLCVAVGAAVAQAAYPSRPILMID